MSLHFIQQTAKKQVPARSGCTTVCHAICKSMGPDWGKQVNNLTGEQLGSHWLLQAGSVFTFGTAACGEQRARTRECSISNISDLRCIFHVMSPEYACSGTLLRVDILYHNITPGGGAVVELSGSQLFHPMQQSCSSVKQKEF